MSLLSYIELCELVEQGVITNTPFDRVNSASIDISLGSTILVEAIGRAAYAVSLSKKQKLAMDRYDISVLPYRLHPGEFILAQSEQEFNLPPDISAEYKLKSSMARIGLEHLTAGWCDAGWHGSVLTLELKNMTQGHIIELEAGILIGQMVFFRHTPVPHDKSYAVRGRYNGDKTVTAAKSENG